MNLAMISLLSYAPNNPKNIFLTYGYLRELRDSLLEISPFYQTHGNTDLPIDVKNMCLIFYDIPIFFDKKNDILTENFTILDESAIYHNKNIYQQVHICLIGKQISDKMCKKFAVTIRWANKIIPKYDDGEGVHVKKDALQIGFVKGDADQGKIMRRAWLGCDDIAEISEGIMLRENDNNFVRFEPLEEIKTKKKICRGDTFTMIFRFDRNECYIKHNNIPGIKLSLNGWKSIIPTIMMTDWYDIVRCRWIFWV